jgi:dipeptidase E
MRLLLSSNSTLQGEPYLNFCKGNINEFLAESNVENVIFIPFAAIRFSYESYEKMVIDGLGNDKLSVKSIHRFENKKKALEEADAIVVGGGNTFHLLHQLYHFDLVDSIRTKVAAGTPYIGWSAGSNLACPSVKTTNDMPIIFPPSFDGLNLIPFQINPHYIHGNPSGHNGETREERLEEFLEKNKPMTVVGLREGTLIQVEGDQIQLIGDREMRVFQYKQDYYELKEGDDLSFLMA